MNTPTKCFAHHHQSPAEHGFWNVARALSYESGIFYFSGPRFALRFGPMSKNTAYALADRLVESGWLKLIKESQRRKNGEFTPTHYKVLSHEEWAAEHPSHCETTPFAKSGNGEDQPLPNSDLTIPKIRTDHYQNLGTNLKEPTHKKQLSNQPDYQEPLPEFGIGDFVDKFSKRRGQRPSAAAPRVLAQPLPKSGHGVNDTQAEAEQIAHAITSSLKLTHPDQLIAWAAGVNELIYKGHSPETISFVADFAHTHCRAGTMQHEGAAGFVKHFDRLAQAAFKGKEGSK